MFNAQVALQSSNYLDCVQNSSEQRLLNIDEKTRTSVLPWRGQFSPQLVEYLIKKHAITGGLILDPFGGSGTVLYEAAAQGHDAIAIDINPAAIALAKASSICNVLKKNRIIVLNEIEQLSLSLMAAIDKNNGSLCTDSAAKIFHSMSEILSEPNVSLSLLMSVFGNTKETNSKAVSRAKQTLRRLIIGAPESSNKLKSQIGDARRLDIKTNSIDYLITSPPYINVFNYHQNYRPIIQALGFVPLTFARAEIGANRKFRANRYITVVQYCMDIALFLTEAARVLKDNSPLTIVLGRESNVRGVAFKNSELVAAIASKGLGGMITEWNERNFLNRYGKTIYEDVITIYPNRKPEETAIKIGRSVGIEALKDALTHVPINRIKEINDAIEKGHKIPCSDYVLEETYD